MSEVTLTLNGREWRGGAPEGATLAEALREQVGLTGTKIACAEGTCGACTVLVDGRAVLSCILLAAQADGCEVTTIEGLGDEGALSPLQRAFVEEDALQCGFCTAGQIVSATALLAGDAAPDERAGAGGDERQPLPLRRLSRNRARGAAGRRGADGGLMAKLQKTSVEMEGRFEERWVLVEDEPEAWEDERELSVAGTRVARLTGPRRVSGAARYVSDVALPGMLQGVVVRSPHAHATVTMDVAAALAVPGVHALLSPADEDAKEGRRRDLQRRAGLRRRARRGARVRGRGERRAPPSPRWTSATSRSASSSKWRRRSPSSACRRTRSRTRAATSRPAWTRRTSIIEGEYATSAQVHHALEPHCAVAQWLGDELHAFVSTQGIWDARQQLARAFGLDPDRVHVTCEFMGGGFGAKQGPTTEGLIAAYLSRAAGGRAVRVFNDRRSEASRHGPPRATQQTYRIGARRDGTLTAIEVTSVVANPMRGWVEPDHDPGAHALPLRQRACPGDPAADRRRAVERVPRARRHGGDVRLRERARRARRRALARPARRCAAPTTSTSTRSAACRTRPRTSRPASTAPPSLPAGASATRCATACIRTAVAAASAPPARSGGAAAARPRTRSCAWAATASSRSSPARRTSAPASRRRSRWSPPRSSACRSTACASRSARPATACTRRSRAAPRRCPRWPPRCAPRPTTCAASCSSSRATSSRSRPTTCASSTASSSRSTAACASRSPR